MISFCKRFAFPHVNKAGGTSIIDAFSDYEDATGEKFVHAHAWIYRDYIGHALWNEFKTFGMIRNPLSRAVSSYEYRRQILPPTNNSIPAKSLNFSSWVKGVVTTQPFDREWGSQVRMLSHKDTVDVVVDRVYFFEDLRNVFPEICDWLEVPRVELPHFNKTEKPHWSTYYDDETAEIIEKRYSDDFVYQRDNSETPWKTWNDVKDDVVSISTKL